MNQNTIRHQFTPQHSATRLQDELAEGRANAAQLEATFSTEVTPGAQRQLIHERDTAQDRRRKWAGRLAVAAVVVGGAVALKGPVIEPAMDRVIDGQAEMARQNNALEPVVEAQQADSRRAEIAAEHPATP